ncbi:phosphate acetyltransferase [Acinetobacter qingfengensis]|uniref:Phosphate acetyltransferase n=1 Tax=Acinetobacter qingfengensis TaxID=1262585 RepID=A0A1E7RDX9_9GAMM|nr:phosphate acetyltransferase [Acinetobacter qingfengensis]KAA8734505.1 phosphate acetyltransferase [Acinetobacter qingfengensis]OEY97541.1 phosphate acetyltransferase [Acinetobacter qingfengensis]
MKTFILVPTAENIGLTSACLGFIQALDCIGIKANFLKPFSQEKNAAPSRSSALIAHIYQRPQVTPISFEKINHHISTDNIDDLLEDVVSLHRQISAAHEVVIVEGLTPNADQSYTGQLNNALAQALDAQVILISSADINAPEQTAELIERHLRPFGGLSSARTAGVLFMRSKGLPAETAQIPVATDQNLRLNDYIDGFTSALQRFAPLLGSQQFPVIGLVPFSATLSVPRTLDIARAIQANWLNEGKADQRRVQHSSLISGRIEHELDKFIAGELLIASSDRSDVVLASSVATLSGVPVAGVVLTDSEKHASDHIHGFVEQAYKAGLPVMRTPQDTFQTMQQILHIANEVPADDIQRAEQITRFVSSHIDFNWLKQVCDSKVQPRLSPSAFRHELAQKSIAAKKRIVLPEGAEPRTIQAAIICQTRGIAHCILLAKPEEVHDVAKARNLQLPDDLEIVDPDQVREKYIAPMVELRKGKLDAIQAKDQLQDTVVLGTMMLALDEVDGLVSGAIHTTANTIRPAFQLIKTAPEYSLVSSVFFMLLPDEVYVYGDCAVNPNPTAEQLAEIAIQSADSAQAFGIEPRIAMISYSTGDSGTGAEVEKVKTATQIAQQRRPDLKIDGPLQYDAASVESVGKQKAPNSPVAGQANVFIFPDLNTGNTTYKAVQRSANVVSVGPMLQGLNKPVNDLSRGALVDDIVFTIALTAIQATQK